MFTFPKKAVAVLDQYNATAHFRAQAGSENTFACEIKDKATGKVWHSAVGVGKEAALMGAINSMNPDAKPKTPAELAAENEKLRRELAEARGEPIPQNQPSAEQPATPATEPEPEPDDGLSEFSSSEIVQALASRNLEPPEGDKRTKEWREAALKLLREHEAAPAV
jgi:hypothetical protein